MPRECSIGSHTILPGGLGMTGMLVAGGSSNTVSGSTNSLMLGGSSNVMYDTQNGSFVIGGTQNQIKTNGLASDWSGIIGGRGNILNGDNDYSIIIQSQFSEMSNVDFSGIYGGLSNTITGSSTSGINGHNIIGGEDHLIALAGSNDYNTIIGGTNHMIIGDTTMGGSGTGYASIIGSYNCKIDNSWGAGIFQSYQSDIYGDSWYSTIIGGEENVISGHTVEAASRSSIIGGYQNEINHKRSVILGGSGIVSDADDTTFTPNLTVTSAITANNITAITFYGDGSNLTGVGGGTPETVSATTTTVHFSGQTIFHKYTNQATGNISEDLTGAKLGIVQKIYHNDSTEPTYPAGWVLMGDGVYFTSQLNIIYCEWAEGSRVEYWYVQEQ